MLDSIYFRKICKYVNMKLEKRSENIFEVLQRISNCVDMLTLNVIIIQNNILGKDTVRPYSIIYEQIYT